MHIVFACWWICASFLVQEKSEYLYRVKIFTFIEGWIWQLKGEVHLKVKLSMFFALSHNCQNFFVQWYDYLKEIVWETQKWHWNFLVGPVAHEFLIKTWEILLWSITQEPLGLQKFACPFWVSQTICFSMIIKLFC